MPKDERDSERDPNFFVNFRRATDDHISSIFDSFADPFRSHARQDEQWRNAREDMWRRFERSYERATNPERRQIDGHPEAARQEQAVNVAKPRVEDAYSEDNVRRREAEVQKQGIFARMLSGLGKTSLEEESARMVADHWKTKAGKSDNMRRQGIAATEAERAEEIGRRIDRCPWVQEQYQAEEPEAAHRARRPYACAMSWGPWGWEVASKHDQQNERNIKDDETDDVRREEHTFGPWDFGPIHVGPMSMSASFPKDMEAEFGRALEEMERHRKQLVEQMSHAQRRLLGESEEVDPRQASSDVRQYSPIDLAKRPESSEHLNWRQAYEDLMAAEMGDEMLGKTPWGCERHESDDSWRARMTDRGLFDSQEPWHRRMLGLEDPETKLQKQQGKLSSDMAPTYDHGSGPQTSQDAPHTELEFYDSISAKPSPLQQKEERPDILSTLTTVETVTNPDGSTTIKRSLKRHFADGRMEQEDSTESTPAIKAQQQPTLEQSQPKPSMAQQLREQDPNKGKWFWS